VRAAIATGFKRARLTVLDANITTLFTALVLFEYGTGPIKGFAVTLSIGIVTSVFAALVITRLLFEIYPGSRTSTELSI
jgi:preprotein translocase subunit SecD